MTPRFDSPTAAVLNLVGIAVFVVAVVRWLQLRRAGRRLEGVDILLLVHLSVAGIYLPAGPLVWLWVVRDAQPVRATP